MSGRGWHDDPGAPRWTVRLVGRGEEAMRMDKRLRCAGRALGIDVRVEWETSRYGAPAAWIGDELLVDHLVDTAELENLLRRYRETL